MLSLHAAVTSMAVYCELVTVLTVLCLSATRCLFVGNAAVRFAGSCATGATKYTSPNDCRRVIFFKYSEKRSCWWKCLFFSWLICRGVSMTHPPAISRERQREREGEREVFSDVYGWIVTSGGYWCRLGNDGHLFQVFSDGVNELQVQYENGLRLSSVQYLQYYNKSRVVFYTGIKYLTSIQIINTILRPSPTFFWLKK